LCYFASTLRNSKQASRRRAGRVIFQRKFLVIHQFGARDKNQGTENRPASICNDPASGVLGTPIAFMVEVRVCPRVQPGLDRDCLEFRPFEEVAPLPMVRRPGTPLRPFLSLQEALPPCSRIAASRSHVADWPWRC